MRAAAYVRLSKETEETTSPARQRDVCAKLIAERGWEPAGVFEDLDVSAYSGRRRPAFEDMMGRLDDLDVIVFWRLDRLARSTVGFGQILERCSAAKVGLVSASEPFDTSTPIGEAMAWIVMTFAQLESRTTGLRISATLEHLRATGRFRGGDVPFGWQAVPREGGGKKLVADPVEAPLVRELVERIIAGDVVRRVGLDWNQRGVRTRRGALWSDSQLRRIVRSPQLIGQVMHEGRIVRDDKGVPVPGPEPLIDSWTWRRLQSELDSRKVVRRKHHQALLAGLLVCAHCGARLARSSPNARTATYSCYRRSHHGPDACPGNAISMRHAEAYVVAAVHEYLTPEVLNEARERVAAERSARALPSDLEAERIRQALDELERDRYELGLYDSPDGRDRWARLYQRLTTQLDALGRPEPATVDVVQLLGGRSIQDAWPELDTMTRRSVLGAVIDQVLVTKPEQRPGFGRPFDPSRLEIRWHSTIAYERKP